MFELKTFEEIGAKTWDGFVLTCPNGSIHQTSAWKELQETVPTRGKVFGFAVLNNQKIEATCLVVRMRTGFFSTEWHYSGRGPVFTSQETAEFLILEIAKFLKQKTSSMFLRFDPYILESEKALDLKLKLRPSTADYHPLNSSIIALDKPPEELLKSLKKKRRYDIRTGLKNFDIKFFTASNATEQNITDFYGLLSKTAKRDGFEPHPKSYYSNFLSKLENYATIWFATKGDQVAAAAIMTIFGDKAIYYFAATTDEPTYRKLGPSHALVWSMLEYASRCGAKTFDLLGTAPPDEPSHPYSGITKFKQGFGGDDLSYQKGKEIVFRPLAYRLYRLAKVVKK